MLKKYVAIFMAIVMCMSILLTGCAQESTNVDDNNDNEQVSTEVASGENTDKVENENTTDAAFSTSQWKAELAKRNALSEYDVKSYSDFALFANQSDWQLLRDTLSPGRDKNFPLATIFGDSNMSSFTSRYFNNGYGSGSSYMTMAENAYFQDAFYFFGNSLEIDVTYLKPGIAENIRECFTKTTYKCFGWDKNDACVFVDFDADMIDGNSLLKLNEDSIPDANTAAIICDEVMLVYDRKGDLFLICILVDDTYIYVRCQDGEGHVAPISSVFDRLDSSNFISYLLNSDTVLVAKSILTTVKNEFK